jgi:hypothetical protein
MGGVALGSYVSYNRVFMGGGGGGGQQNNSLGTVGANGGGIIFIKAARLATSCSGSLNISAGGASAATSGNDGAGGAGGGGSIVLQVTTFIVPSSCPLNISANGGAGGNVGDAAAHGGGGGGGQGAIIYSASLPSANITTTTNNGLGGLNSGSAGATSAGSGAGINNAGVLTGLNTVLPVTIASFRAQRNGNGNDLYWSSGDVSQHLSFDIQRSVDGVSFNTIGTVDEPTGGTSTQEYRYTDHSPAPGKNFYRLMSTGLAGGQTWSAIVSIDRSAAQQTLSVYPNPAGRQFTISLETTANPTVLVNISDLAGKIVWSRICQASGRLIPVSINDMLTPGIYFVSLTSNGQKLVGRLFIR